MGPDSRSEVIRVQVVYAAPERQVLLGIEVPRGCTVSDAIELSGIRQQFPKMNVESGAVGVFSEKVALDHRLRDGDRVEIYRPLLADPRELRKQRAGRKPG